MKDSVLQTPDTGQKIRVLASIPAYNEGKTIASMIKEIPRHIEGIDSIEVLLIDADSTDNTASEAMKVGADEIVTHKG